MLKLKICGLKDPENYTQVAATKPDFIGLNFYKKSPRYIGEAYFTKSNDVKVIGVFVNENIESVIEKSKLYQLDMVQLHGCEPAEYCAALKKEGLVVIKALQLNEDFDFFILNDFISTTDYFLFDAPGKLPGGNAKVFNWDILEYYPFQKPFFLAGGLTLENIQKFNPSKYPQLMALDVNSGFESSAGVKDVKKIIQLKKILDAKN